METPGITEITFFQKCNCDVFEEFALAIFSVSGKEVMRWPLYLIINMEVI